MEEEIQKEQENIGQNIYLSETEKSVEQLISELQRPGVFELAYLKGLIETVTTVPTHTPSRFEQQIKLYVDNLISPSTKQLYVYSGQANVWIPLLGMFSSQYSSKEYDNGNVTGTATIDWNNGNVQYVTMTGDTTFTFSNPISGGRYLLLVAGAYTPTWPLSVKWPAGTAPTATATSGKKDLYTFVYSAKESLYNGIQSANFATS